jgi:hypothetical protein
VPPRSPAPDGGHRYDFAAEPDWVPVERLAQLCQSRRDLPDLDPDDFMYMGRAVHPTLPAIHFYKHTRTRRYLNLDATGHAYTWAAGSEPGRWSPIGDLVSAIGRVHDLSPPRSPSVRPPLAL